MNATRRSVLQAIPMLAASSAFASDSPTISSFIKPFDELPVKQNGQNQSRPILDGLTHSGDHLEVHETTLAPGSAPHPPHQHEHEELFLMMKGSLAVTIAGKTAVIGRGARHSSIPTNCTACATREQKMRNTLWWPPGFDSLRKNLLVE